MTPTQGESQVPARAGTPRVVIVGGGFAGFFAARDLGGAGAVARPLGIPSPGRGQAGDEGLPHVRPPVGGNRLRVLGEWALNAVSRPPAVQLGLVDPSAARMDAAEKA